LPGDIFDWKHRGANEKRRARRPPSVEKVRGKKKKENLSRRSVRGRPKTRAGRGGKAMEGSSIAKFLKEKKRCKTEPTASCVPKQGAERGKKGTQGKKSSRFWKKGACGHKGGKNAFHRHLSQQGFSETRKQPKTNGAGGGRREKVSRSWALQMSWEGERKGLFAGIPSIDGRNAVWCGETAAKQKIPFRLR